ncbi:uncharacterized protein BHQ10_001383 [Talaromyces amestolkiae]|uniref:ATPase, vacuolar ER assembly factor, Vma12 n=1 Tax=Talaromyces amestolkiae TaxID=1196081 RepID=A0A364KPD2_TALAM|nr:uncharacterized protein BHQ10_001383 [Talaromyces amestolkiae]RAO65371.1 hypothetical protein BHQ10_001383 [Talaromyces amestolkiae]
MVLLTTTPLIAKALNELSASTRLDLNLPEHIPPTGAPISHDQLISLGRQRNGYTLNNLLKGTKVYIPPPPPKPEPTPEYLALKARLQALADEQAYNALIAPNSTHLNPYKPSSIFADTPTVIENDENVEDMVTPSLVINIFMSVILCGFATFWALKNFQTPSFLGWILLSPTGRRDGVNTGGGGATRSKDPVFVLIAMSVGLLVGVAETVVYAAYVRKVKYAKAAERKVKERKEVVSSVELGGEKNDTKVVDDNADGEEIIWGKGVNGGVRRRVRERWETLNDDSQ